MDKSHPHLGSLDEDEGISMGSMSDYQDPFEARKTSSSSKRALKTCFVHYETIFWIVFAVLSLYAILDRFFVNLYPMSINFRPLAGSCVQVGTTCTNSLALKGIYIPWSVSAFDIFGRATGRLFLVVFGALFYTQCKTTENWLMEHHPSRVRVGDLRTINNRVHYILGVFFMTIPMIAHLLITFLPALSGVPLTISANRAVHKVTPFIAYNPLTGSAEMFLIFDDFYRLILSLFLFLIVFPFSMSNWTRKRWFSPTQWLHIAGAALFSVDMIRRSPHSQVFNTPVIFYFLVDRFVGYFYYRVGVASIIHKEILDDEYMILFLYIPKQKRRRSTGSTYYLQFLGLEGMFDIAHPYIAFQNHSGQPMIPEWRNRDQSSSEHKFYIDRSTADRRAFGKQQHDSELTSFFQREDGNGNEELDEMAPQNEDGVAQNTDSMVFFSNWNTAFFIQIHKWNRGESSFSAKLMTKELAERVRFWGPFTSEYSLVSPIGQSLPPIVMIGTGAGAGPLVDFYLYITASKVDLLNPVSVYFSTQSIGLFQFVTDLLCCKKIHNLHVSAHLTQSSDYTMELSDKGSYDNHSSVREMSLGRLSFLEVLAGAPSDAKVFFCGAPALQWLVQIAARTHNLDYFPGHRFSSDGVASCQRVGICRFVCACSKFPCCLTY